MGEQYVHHVVSQNFRMSELEAAWLRQALPLLAAGNERRRRVVDNYRAAAPSLGWQAAHPRHVYHLAVARFAQRDAARARLAELGVGTAVHYPLALTQQPAYRHLTRAACPVAEQWAATCVSLPCFPELTDDEVALVADALSRVVEEGFG
jgi:dTDP-4-amino-4,6-dideoxygalactose transaminase